MAQKRQQKHPLPDWLTPHAYANNTGKPAKPVKPKLQKPRLPTMQEQEALIDYVMKKDNQPEDQRSNLASLFFGGDCPVVIFDHYATYRGEYAGKLLVVVSDIDPNNTTCFIWKHDGSIEEVTRSTLKQLRKRYNSTI